MKVYYHSSLDDSELAPGIAYRAIPCKACLKLVKDKDEAPCELLYNGEIIDSETAEIKCGKKAELVIRQDGKRYDYVVRPFLVQPLSDEYARAYEQFFYEYQNMEFDEIGSIQLGALKLYAVDQTTEIRDYSHEFEQLRTSFNAFKFICEKPKSHLKAVNEVRPIETVKRVGYESIPYLAAHSEDWLARTASGLKPARLFSRVEDDEYQIYENRVVKTLIDLILEFLRKTEKQLRDRRDQLRGIINSSVQTGSFGFDVSFQKAVHELISLDNEGYEYRSEKLRLAETLQAEAYSLLKRYRGLRRSRLYRYLKNSKPVPNPLNETNILVIDKHYSVIFKLWKTIHALLAPRAKDDECDIPFENTCKAYQQFCVTLCGYAAHVLGFELLENGHYERTADCIDLMVHCDADGLIRVSLKDAEPRVVRIQSKIDVPISPGTSKYRIYYDGYSLKWPNDITDDEIDAFCSLFKNRNSRGKEQSEERFKYVNLKSFLLDKAHSFDKPQEREFVLIPIAGEIELDNRISFNDMMESVARKYAVKGIRSDIILAMPTCNENEQKMSIYVKEKDQNISLLPLTMFDINSYRRIQNMLYRQILKLGKDSCPNCGGKMRKHDNQLICDSCNQLTLTKTICPNPGCRHEYVYMGYDVSNAILEKMQEVRKDSFFEWDSLYQYKDIVRMTVDSEKIRTVCPFCHKS